jgi:hypothetical protein
VHVGFGDIAKLRHGARLAQDGRVRRIFYGRDFRQVHEYEKVPQRVDLVGFMENHHLTAVVLELDSAPFQVEVFIPEARNGWPALYHRLTELGIPLSSEEEALWASRL